MKLISALEKTISEPFYFDELRAALLANYNPRTGKVYDEDSFRAFFQELKLIAQTQDLLRKHRHSGDGFGNYAPLYDAIIGYHSIEFILNYFRYFERVYQINWSDKNVLSVGCGTGMVEQQLIQHLGIQHAQLLGIDISEAMVKVALDRIRAKKMDILALDQKQKQFDIVLSTLNVYQYLNSNDLANAVSKSAACTQTGGYFVGDFIPPDHIDWYPHILFSQDEKIISIRNPHIIDATPFAFQESEIVNIDTSSATINYHYAGTHRRILPSIPYMRALFQQHFGPEVDIYDAVDLQTVLPGDSSCKSKRYVIIAKKLLD